MSSILSIERAAIEANISIRHFRRVYYQDGAGKFFQIGRKYFVLRKDFQSWLDTNRGRVCIKDKQAG